MSDARISFSNGAMINRVRDVIAAGVDDDYDTWTIARRVIAAMREPTDAQLESAKMRFFGPADKLRELYRAIIDAALAEDGKDG